MMSKEKYQMALNTLFMMASEHLGFELNYEKNLLQELVDKATPKKLHKENKQQEWSGGCPNCHSDGIWSEEMMLKHKYCKDCGQAIDWSENE